MMVIDIDGRFIVLLWQMQELRTWKLRTVFHMKYAICTHSHPLMWTNLDRKFRSVGCWNGGVEQGSQGDR
jgi:hypothetical protein